jgi:hypothetical protein
MNTLILSLVLLSSTSGAFGADPKEDPVSTEQVIATQALLATVMILDGANTRHGIKCGYVEEQNPLMGTTPSAARLWGIGLAAFVAHSVVTYYMPFGYREAWQWAAIAAEAVVFTGNLTELHHYGVKIKFAF